MPRSVIWIVVGVVVGFLLVAGVTMTKPYTMRGSVIDPPVAATDFTLIDGQGRDWKLSDQQGRVVLMFFGYTTCPDICPATLGSMQQVLVRLGKQAQDVEVVFVTVDPQRDTPERLGKYVSAFDDSFVGLSGSEPELQPVWKAYGVYRAINENAGGAGYLVDHSTRTYLIDRSGMLRATYSFGAPMEDIMDDVKHLLKEKVAQQ